MTAVPPGGIESPLKIILKQYWGFDQFRPLQQRAVEAVLAARDSLVVLPTGGGKSLCFQAPALAVQGVAIVASPLIALMKDQVDGLRANGVSAACLHSGLDPQERRAVERGLLAGEYKLLYASPERLAAESFISLLQQIEVSFFAIDEAHCISMWGHDFRPEYRQLARLRELFPGVAVHAYTATATELVRKDIVNQLQLRDPEVLVGSFDRPNLVFKVQRRASLIEQVIEVIKRHPNEAGIIYCIRRRDVEQLAEQLRAKGYKALPYHAGMEDADRHRNQEAFIREEVDIIVATVAFGMGIDKSNVRYVIHGAMPKSVEHYQQETGRAGRDGLEAECVLLYSGADYSVWEHFTAEMEPDARKAALAQLGGMYDYAQGCVCRRVMLLNYFGEEYHRQNCDGCDVCLGELEGVDDSQIIAQKILSCIVRLDQRFGGEYTAEVLLGSKSERILSNGHDRLSTYGLLVGETKKNVRYWIDQLIGAGYIKKEGEFATLAVTSKGWKILRNEATVQLFKPAAEKAREAKVASKEWKGVDRSLFDRLKALRAEIATEKKVPPYLVFGDRTLRELAKLRPLNKQQFLEIHGIGERKWKTFGDQFLDAIIQYNRLHPEALEPAFKRRPR